MVILSEYVGSDIVRWRRTMKILPRFCAAVLASCLFFAGCARSVHAPETSASPTKPEGARLSTAEVIRIAKQTAVREGVDLRHYKEPEAHYELSFKDKSWFVFFDGKVAMPGNHFSVSVDDQTAEAQFFGGR